MREICNDTFIDLIRKAKIILKPNYGYLVQFEPDNFYRNKDINVSNDSKIYLQNFQNGRIIKVITNNEISLVAFVFN